MAIEYAVTGVNDLNEPSDRFELENTGWEGYPRYLAEECAEDYYSNHDGWERNWPITIHVFSDGNHIGEFSVELESEPVFSASLSK
ncbi:hypothetical protein FE392_18050 [Xenorhabdus sp. 12]|uniref:Uncharacterized protein n=1 Tax=Xenorhabdus santafensis TaxID=2582833 RepID=A0ABU4SEG4_9GAMM|nr:hypothetical protein [Xenorhabdus sp. 12]MDX7989189.1 hypothetical protein [Xenorhabdus sp. 12]